jgi:hypothetical protein
MRPTDRPPDVKAAAGGEAGDREEWQRVTRRARPQDSTEHVRGIKASS